MFSVFQAKEGIEQLVYLCRTDKDEVRDAAKQALLVLGITTILFLLTMIHLSIQYISDRLKFKTLINCSLSFMYSYCHPLVVIYMSYIGCILG